MTINISLEERLAAVEAAITELQKQVAVPQLTNWLQQITGSFKDESAFDEVLAYGRTIREGDESISKHKTSNEESIASRLFATTQIFF